MKKYSAASYSLYNVIIAVVSCYYTLAITAASVDSLGRLRLAEAAY